MYDEPRQVAARYAALSTARAQLSGLFIYFFLLSNLNISTPTADAYDTDQLIIEWTKPDPIARNPDISMSDMHITSMQPGLCDGNYTTGTSLFSSTVINCTILNKILRMQECLISFSMIAN